MSLRKEVLQAIAEKTSDDSVARRFANIWPLAERIFEAFAHAMELPIFVYLGDHQIFQSSRETMPKFCCLMLENEDFSLKCMEDGRRRATMNDEADDSQAGTVHLCHAGLANGRKSVNIPPLGELVVLYGSRQSELEGASLQQEKVIGSAPSDLGKKLSEAAGVERKTDIADQEKILIDAIIAAIESLFQASLGFHWVSVNMAHELCNIWVGTGLAFITLKEDLEHCMDQGILPAEMTEMYEDMVPLLAECRLGAYVCRNFLSHVSESRYSEVQDVKFRVVDLGQLIQELIDLHVASAKRKDIKFESQDLLDLPKIYAIEEEVRRVMHNALSNAIKYSYHSGTKKRTIKIWAKVPYDPGFRSRRFSVVIQNYGLGLSPDEISEAVKPGFRGKQALSEVPIGSGIGLSEIKKVMLLHGGDMKIRSHAVHRDQQDQPTYLTELELIFPYSRSSHPGGTV